MCEPLDSLLVNVGITSFYFIVRKNMHMYICVFYCKYCVKLDI